MELNVRDYVTCTHVEGCHTSKASSKEATVVEQADVPESNDTTGRCASIARKTIEINDMLSSALYITIKYKCQVTV